MFSSVEGAKLPRHARWLVALGAAILFPAKGALAESAAVTFASAQAYGLGPTQMPSWEASRVAMGDVNRDGNVDIVVANEAGPNVSVLLGVGGGTFNPTMTLDMGGKPRGLVVCDLNLDGVLDIATASRHFNAPYHNVWYRLGGANGSFGDLKPLVAGWSNSLTTADVDRNGWPDLVAVGPEVVSVLLGDPNGGFKPLKYFVDRGGGNSIAIGDLDRNGTDDLAIANAAANKSVWITLGTGTDTGTFSAKALIVPTNAPNGSWWLAVDDIDVNGTLDIVVANASQKLSILLGKGDGTFAADKSIDTAGNFVVIGDLNSDGLPDLIASAGVGVAVLRGKGGGEFEPATYFAAGVARGLAVGDLNKDGRLDVVVANPDSKVSVLLNTTVFTVAP